MSVQPLLPVQVRSVAVQYDGTNSDQFLSMFSPASSGAHILSESGGVLTMMTTEFYGQFSISAGEYMVFQFDPFNGSYSVSGVMTLAQMQNGYLTATGSAFTGS